jgi:hypothetical protein
MAIPANWAVGGKHLGKLLRPQFSPLNRLVVWAEQPWRVIQVVKFAESFVTNRALLSFIPLRNNIPDQAVLRICFDLLQAFLATVLPKAPTAASPAATSTASVLWVSGQVMRRLPRYPK